VKSGRNEVILTVQYYQFLLALFYVYAGMSYFVAHQAPRPNVEIKDEDRGPLFDETQRMHMFKFCVSKSWVVQSLGTD
jgi:hypothetical protein